MRITHRGSWLAAVLAALALLATACGTSDTAADDDAADPGQETTDDAAASEPGDASEASEEMEEASPEDGSEEAATDGTDGTGGALIGYSQPIGRDPAIATIVQVLEQELAAAGHEFVTTDANLDPGKQISDIDSLVNQGVDVLIVNPIGAEATKPALDRAREAGVAIISQEAVEAGPYETVLITQNLEAAREMAGYLAEQVGDGGVAAIEGPPIAEVVVARNTGFREGAAEAGLTVLDTQVNDQITPEGARAIASTLQQQLGDELAGLWAFNDTSALGAASAFTGEPPVIVSMNGQPEVVEAIREGTIAATWDLQIVKYAKLMAWSADQVVQGADLPETVLVEMPRIDADNVDQWQPPEELIGQEFEVELEERDDGTYLVTE